MKKIVVMVVRDEEFFIRMGLESILPYVDGVYILDTGSKDSTLQILNESRNAYKGKLVFEQGDFGGDRRFAQGYREKDARNHAVERAIQHFDPDWITCMDADEIFLPQFWEAFGTKITMNNYAVGHPTEMLISTNPVRIGRHPEKMVNWSHVKATQLLHDPHVRTWNTRKNKVRWEHFPNRHVILSSNGVADLSCDVVLEEPIHFHFHHTFGAKAIYTWIFGEHRIDPHSPDGLLPNEYVYSQEKYKLEYPQLFNNKGQFTPPISAFREAIKHSVELPKQYNIPSVVLQRWEEWGAF